MCNKDTNRFCVLEFVYLLGLQIVLRSFVFSCNRYFGISTEEENTLV